MRTSTRCGSALPWCLIVRGFSVPSLVRFGRSAAGRVVEVTQPTGRSYRYEWDECGRWAATVSTGGDRREIVHDADSRFVGGVRPTGAMQGTVSVR
ncbi:RHS repeat domain-containing protein [Propionibacterium acidifaciens]|uniref:RHS repeat domain-containing protein n=1 Tax=Propionibacterium acidifaciens TaxID=556499 RepID=UPI0036F31FC2